MVAMKAERRDSGMVSIVCTLTSTPENVRTALADIARSLADSPCPPQPGEMWEVAMAEVLNNIVEHAYEQEPDGKIRVEIDFDHDRIRADITDFGRPMPGGVPPEGAPADLDVPTEHLPEGGFGWFLIRSLAEQLDYRQENGANRLRIVLPR